MTTKTEQRRERIKRGTSKDSTLAARADEHAAIEEIRKISGQSHTDHGASSIDEIQLRQAQRESMAADTYSAPKDSDGAALVELNIREDPRHVPIGFLLDDLRRRVRTWTRGFTKDERLDIATDALLILARWTKQGSTAPIQLGPRGELPLRRVWFDPDKRTVIRDGKATRPAPGAAAERAMRAAILQAARDRNSDAESALLNAKQQLETSSIDAETSERSLAAESLRRDQQQSERAPSLPDTDAPELLAQAMGITLTAARAALAQGYRLSTDQCAGLWNVSSSRAENIRSTGRAELLKRYPEPSELLDALAAAAPEVRELLATRAYLAVRDLAAAPRDQRLVKLARQKVNEWRASVGELPMERRAIELAATRIGWNPELISATDHLYRLLRAVRKVWQSETQRAVHGSHLPALSMRLGDASVEQLAQLAPSTAWRRLPLIENSSRAVLYAQVRADEGCAHKRQSATLRRQPEGLTAYLACDDCGEPIRPMRAATMDARDTADVCAINRAAS